MRISVEGESAATGHWPKPQRHWLRRTCVVRLEGMDRLPQRRTGRSERAGRRQDHGQDTGKTGQRQWRWRVDFTA